MFTLKKFILLKWLVLMTEMMIHEQFNTLELQKVKATELKPLYKNTTIWCDFKGMLMNSGQIFQQE